MPLPRDKHVDPLERHGRAVALALITTDDRQPIGLHLRFDAFGYQPEVDCPGKGDDARNDAHVGAVFHYVVD